MPILLSNMSQQSLSTKKRHSGFQGGMTPITVLEFDLCPRLHFSEVTGILCVMLVSGWQQYAMYWSCIIGRIVWT